MSEATGTETRRRSRLVDTALGPVQCELTDGEGPVVLASHAGIGGVDQARLMLDWLPVTATDGCWCRDPVIWTRR